MKLHTYVNFGGNCEEAFQFYEKNLGGKLMGLMRWREMPNPEKNVPPGYENAVMHARIALGETVLMGSDSPDFQPLRGMYLSLSVDSDEEAERIYALLADGGEIVMKMEQTFFAHRFGLLRDKFGTPWMIVRERS